MSETKIIYRDIAPGAEDAASVTTSGAQPFSQIAQLPHGLDCVPTCTCELNHWGLDGVYTLRGNRSVAFWSAEISDADGAFDSPPVITITLSENFSSTGISLVFGDGNWAASVKIDWYLQSTLRASKTFSPNRAEYFCSNKVTSYDKVVLTFLASHLPYQYIKLEHIVFGVVRTFGMEELRGSNVVKEMNLIAEELPVSNLNWTLQSRDNVDYLFQFKQPVEVQNGGETLGVFYIDDSTRLGESTYDIKCIDAIGVLDESPFPGGDYLSGVSATALLTAIVDGAFQVDITVPDVTLYGLLLPSTRREAVQQVLFAWRACAATTSTGTIRVFHPAETEPVDLGKDRTVPGVSARREPAVTAVKVTAHTYTEDSSGSIELDGVKYADAKQVFTVTNPEATSADRERVISVSNATLVGPAIGTAVAQHVFDYYNRRDTLRGEVVWDSDTLGELVLMPNDWSDGLEGHIVKMEIKLSNTVIANSEVRLV